MSAEQLESLYRGLQRAHGTYTVTHADSAKHGKMAGKAITVYEQPTVQKWQDHIDGKVGLGIVPIDEQNTCCWGAIDIDVYAENTLQQVDELVRQLNIPAVCIRTKSGGVHVTVYLTERVAARIVRSKMMEIAAAIGRAGVEIYPKQTSLAGEKDCGNWLNMPYFDAANTTRYAVIGKRRLSLEEFIAHAHSISVTPDQFLAIKITSAAGFDDAPPCLQTMAGQGIAPGTRNDSLFGFGVFARKAFSDDWEAKLDEFNHTFCSPPLGTKEVAALVKSLGRKDYFYPCDRPPFPAFCNKALCKTRKFGIGQGSDDPGITIGRLVKICTSPPTWIIDVEGARFELDTDDLMQQNRFSKLCVEKVNMWPSIVKPHVWRELVQQRLSDVEIIEAPKEASTEGRLMWHLEQFCLNAAPARVRDEILLGKPWTDSGAHYFRSEDLMRYLTQHNFKDLTPRKVWTALRNQAKATHHQFQLKGRCVQCWAVPEFDKQTGAFDVPQPREEF